MAVLPPRTINRGPGSTVNPAGGSTSAFQVPASTRVGVSVQIDFGVPPQPLAVDAPWVQEYEAYVVQPYLIAYGEPYATHELLGFSIGTVGGIGKVTATTGRPSPAAVATGADDRFLAADAAQIGSTFTWPAHGNGDFALIVRSATGPPVAGDGTHAYDSDYQMLVDGKLATFSAVVVDGSQSAISLVESRQLPAGSHTWLAAFTPHVHPSAAFYPIFAGADWVAGFRLGRYEVSWVDEIRGQTNHVVLGGPTILGLSIDAATNHGVLLAAGADSVQTLLFDATGMTDVVGSIDRDIRFGSGYPVDWFEIDHWDRALSLDELGQAAATLEAVYGVTT